MCEYTMRSTKYHLVSITLVSCVLSGMSDGFQLHLLCETELRCHWWTNGFQLLHGAMQHVLTHERRLVVCQGKRTRSSIGSRAHVIKMFYKVLQHKEVAALNSNYSARCETRDTVQGFLYLHIAQSDAKQRVSLSYVPQFNVI